MNKRLTGDRNQCRGCGLYFNSTFAFDKHRVGEHQDNQRTCLSVTGMAAIGMFEGEDGFWRGKRMDERAILSKSGE
jgi:hypothetical protein